MKRAEHARWLSKRALVAHLALVVWVPGCAAAAWWQVTVALSGDRLGYLYSVEWPVFAIFGAVAWWNFIHDDPDAVGAAALRRTRVEEVAVQSMTTRADDEQDGELAEYNAYLAALGAGGKPKTWRRP